MLLLLSCGALYLGLALVLLKHDKLVHFWTFYILSLLFYSSIEPTPILPPWRLRQVTFVVCTAVCGVGLEYVQAAVNPERVFDAYDISCNISGSLLAILTAYTIEKLKRASQLPV